MRGQNKMRRSQEGEIVMWNPAQDVRLHRIRHAASDLWSLVIYNPNPATTFVL